jgi:hypothetical protein
MQNKNMIMATENTRASGYFANDVERIKFELGILHRGKLKTEEGWFDYCCSHPTGVVANARFKDGYDPIVIPWDKIIKTA